MDELLNSITERLGTVSEINHSDENWGQLQYFGSECPVKWPCGLVELASAQFTSNGYDYRNDDLSQQGTLSIEITVANIKLSNTSTKAPISQKNKGFVIWRIIEEVHKKLHGWKPLPNSGAMIRASIQNVKREDGIQEKRIIYTIGLSC